MAASWSWCFSGFWVVVALCSCGHDWDSLEPSANASGPGLAATGGTAGDSAPAGQGGQGIAGQGGSVADAGASSSSQGGASPGQGGAESTGGSSGQAGQGGAESTGGSSGQAGQGGAESTGGTSGQAGQGGAESTGGSSGQAGQGGAQPCACATGEECRQGLCAAGSVSLKTGYEIDRTEVTRSQYAAWLATQPSTSAQDSSCAWNASFAPSAACMADPRVCQGMQCGEHPQVCSDWCDAAAYCRGVGKRLCGRIGGGANAWSAQADAGQSQWMGACSSDGAHKYPYGGGYLGALCNGPENSQTGCASGSCSTQKAGALAGCQSPDAGFLGVIDLSGNAAEWEDSCDAASGAADQCRVRGGSFGSQDGKLELRCNAASSRSRDVGDPTVGFRCCSP